MAFFPILSGCSREGNLEVAEAWARPAIAGGNSAIYFTINNQTNEDDNLLGASSNAAAHVELHMTQHTTHDTTAMEPQDSVLIPAGSKVEFTPGGLHIMLVDLPQGLNPGDAVSLTLFFETAGEVPVEVTVKEP